MVSVMQIPCSARWVETIVPREHHAELLSAITREKKSGQLTIQLGNDNELVIHFVQGHVGEIRWREKVRM